MARANTAVASAATAWLVCSVQCMNSAAQELAANSTKMAANATSPISRTSPRGQTNFGTSTSAGDPPTVVTTGSPASQGRLAKEATAISPPIAANWSRGSRPSWAASDPASAPASTPTLHMPCRPDMIVMRVLRSASTPAVFMALSATPITAPISTKMTVSTVIPGASGGSTSVTPMATVSTQVAALAP